VAAPIPARPLARFRPTGEQDPTVNVRRLAAVPIFGMVLALLYFFWPVQLGGRTAYVTTHGISMEPRFHTGDLAILRTAGTYHVGDVAAYHSSSLHTVVMHRIVRISDGLYYFKGDHNTWLDAAPATRKQLVGKLAFQIKRGGFWFARVKYGLVLLLLLPILFTRSRKAAQSRGPADESRAGPRRRRRSRDQDEAAPPAPRAGLLPGYLKNLPPNLATASGVVAVTGGLALLVVAMTMTAPKPPPPAKHAAVATVAQHATFGYIADVRKSAAYPGTVVTAPAPVYRAVDKDLAATIDYQGMAGTVSVNAVISTASGWSTTVGLLPATGYSGSHFSTKLPLDLAAYEAKATAAADAIKVATGQLFITVQPDFEFAGQPAFSPSFKLLVTPMQVQLISGAASLSADRKATASANPHAAATVATIAIAGRRVPAEQARSIAYLVLGACGLGVLVIVLLARSRTEPSEAEIIKLRHAPTLLSLGPISEPPDRSTIDVSNFATLARIAQHCGVSIMHWPMGDNEVFIARAGDTTCRYLASRIPPGRQRPEPSGEPAVPVEECIGLDLLVEAEPEAVEELHAQEVPAPIV
jgi:signal peptidase I